MRNRIWLLIAVLGVLLGSLIIDVPAVAKFVGIKADLRVHKGLDIQGGTRLVYQTDMSKVPAEDKGQAADGVVSVIRRRVDALGASEPIIQKTSDNERIIVELPGISNVDEAIKLIGETAQLEFREAIVDQSIQSDGTVLSPAYDKWKDVGLTGAQFVKASVDFRSDAQGVSRQEPVISIRFNEEGTKIFKDVTSRNLQKPIAIFLDKELLSAPTVQSAITDGNAIITGDFSLEEAKNLSIQLNAGALPVPITLAQQNNVGPTLGEESIDTSVIAGLIGLLLVILFMLLYYRLPGLVASLALIYYSLVVLALFIYVPVTLTLAGMAGFMLSIGMAVDANILIFERMKEETRAGKSLLSAIDSGLKRAWTSIRDSNASSLITAVILFWFGTGLVKGFALTLGLGIIVSMFTAITVSHLLLRAVAQTPLGKNRVLWGMPISKDNK